MANTYTQLSIHGVFAVARRENIIVAPWRERLHQYLSGLLASETDYALAVGAGKTTCMFSLSYIPHSLFQKSCRSLNAKAPVG